jgi:hypothetical protein
MKRILTALALSASLMTPIIGCKTNTAPAPPLAPGYLTPADQTLGQSLRAATAFRDSEESNYNCDATAAAAQTCLSAAQKAVEKPYLNSLIDAVNLANAAYTAYHSGSQTFAQAQAAYNTAQQAQTALTANKGVK